MLFYLIFLLVTYCVRGSGCSKRYFFIQVPSLSCFLKELLIANAKLKSQELSLFGCSGGDCSDLGSERSQFDYFFYYFLFLFLFPLSSFPFLFSYYLLLFLLPLKNLGRGGGASSRAVAFCLSEPGSNPEMDLGLARLVQNCCESFLAGRLFFFSRTMNRTVHTLASSFLFPSIIFKFVNCNLNNGPGKRI